MSCAAACTASAASGRAGIAYRTSPLPQRSGRPVARHRRCCRHGLWPWRTWPRDAGANAPVPQAELPGRVTLVRGYSSGTCLAAPPAPHCTAGLPGYCGHDRPDANLDQPGPF